MNEVEWRAATVGKSLFMRATEGFVAGKRGREFPNSTPINECLLKKQEKAMELSSRWTRFTQRFDLYGELPKDFRETTLSGAIGTVFFAKTLRTSRARACGVTPFTPSLLKFGIVRLTLLICNACAVSLLCVVVILYLFLSELVLYLTPEIESTMFIDQSAVKGTSRGDWRQSQLRVRLSWVGELCRLETNQCRRRSPPFSRSSLLNESKGTRLRW